MKEVSILSPDKHQGWTEHCHRWAACKDCSLHKTATMHVLARGEIPCDILFVGEAPGSREDATGIPFIGRSGKILDAILDDLLKSLPFSHCIGNILACAPWSSFFSRKVRAPEEEEEIPCLPRLVELHELCEPKGVVLLGLVAEKSLFAQHLVSLETHPPFCGVYHPAYVLRRGGVGSIEYKRVVAALRKFLRSVM